MPPKPMIARITQVTIVPEGEPIFSEAATVITLTDDAPGEYVKVTQCRDDDFNGIAFDEHEWPTIRAEIDAMIARIRERDDA